MKLVGNGSEKAKHHYRPSSQASQKHKPEKMLPVTFGIHNAFLVASTLAARLGPKPVYRNAKCRGGPESSAQAKPSADVPWCREGAHAKRPNSSRIRAHAKQTLIFQ